MVFVCAGGASSTARAWCRYSRSCSRRRAEAARPALRGGGCGDGTCVSCTEAATLSLRVCSRALGGAAACWRASTADIGHPPAAASRTDVTGARHVRARPRHDLGRRRWRWPPSRWGRPGCASAGCPRHRIAAGSMPASRRVARISLLHASVGRRREALRPSCMTAEPLSTA